MTRRLAAGCLAIGILAAPRARADDPYPTRSGETGFVEVPSASVVGRGGSLLGADLRLDHASGEPTRFGPFPIYAVAGLGQRLEAGFSFRQWGRPGDEFPQRTTLGAAAKLKLAQESSSNPALAVDVTGDRLNTSPVLGARLIASGVPSLPIRYAAFAGGEMGPRGGKSGAVVGGALGFGLPGTSEAILEALWGPRGADFGAAARWRVRPTTSVQLGLNYLPDGNGFRLSVGFAFTPRRQARLAPPEERPAVAEAEEAVETPQPGEHREDRPHFRLRVPVAAGAAAQARHLQYGPDLALAVAPDRQAPPPGTRPVAPTLDQLAEAQLREMEALADARDRRVRGTGEQLEAREKAAQAEVAKLEERERDLAAREQQLYVRERQIAAKAPAGPEQRQLESLEAQLAAQERTLSAQERSFGPAVDAAQGREREAAAREDAERREANRLSASVSGASSRALQLEIRKQSVGARNRQLAALEARLVARGERIDALERQLRARAERLDAWSRRLDARADRLDLAERRASEPARPHAAGAAADAGARASRDKVSITMIVKSPTAIVKELAAAPAAGAAAAALHPGVAVEKAVAAATIVTFADPASKLSELDAEALDNIARLAARERCELLIWARAKDPSLMGEAQRRAGEIRTRVLGVGRLDEQQVVTRLTTRPGAQGVDVVVSALRESTKAAPAPAPAPAAPSLLSGESGKRQVREAVQAAQGSIEACVGDLISARNLARAEGVLRLSVSSRGRVTKVAAGEGDLGGTALEDCLNAAGRSWLFPPAEGEYVVDVPITVIRGGAAK